MKSKKEILQLIDDHKADSIEYKDIQPFVKNKHIKKAIHLDEEWAKVPNHIKKKLRVAWQEIDIVKSIIRFDIDRGFISKKQENVLRYFYSLEWVKQPENDNRQLPDGAEAAVDISTQCKCKCEHCTKEEYNNIFHGPIELMNGFFEFTRYTGKP